MDYLLGRAEQLASVNSSFFGGKRVLLTGSCGSVGSVVARILAPLARLTCLDISEQGLFWQARELEEAEYELGDFRELNIEQVRRQDIIIHTAAYKHVNLLEQFPGQAIANNVGAVANLAGLCWHAGRHFCQISTDKAGEAQGLMGKTKWVAERCIDAWRHLGLRCTIIRFANVLGSSGSVKQVWDARQNNHITVTSCDMWRWFITEDEAACHILKAIETTSEKNYLFAIKPPEETNIFEMAQRYARRECCAIKVTHPGQAEKTREKFCHENQHLEPIEGLLYVVRRSDVDDSVCQPGRNLPSAGVQTDTPALKRR